MTNVRQNIANGLTYYISKSDYKQTDIAKLLGVTKQSVSSWLKGTAAPDINTFAKLCEILSVNPKDLFYFNEYVGENHDTSDLMLSRFLDLNEEGQQKLLEYADDLVQSGKYKKSYFTQMVDKNA